MDNTQRTIVVGIATIVVLGIKLRSVNRRHAALQANYRKMYAWSVTAQTLLADAANKYPDFGTNASTNAKIDVEFYNLMTEEGLI